MRVEFYYDVVCPYAYLAHTQLERACTPHGATIDYRPILLGGLFRAVRGDDGPMPTMPESKKRMNLRDMARWAEHWGVPLAMPEAHPRRTVLAMRAIVAADDKPAATRALYEAYWKDGLDVASGEVVAGVLERAGLDGERLVRRATEPDVKDELLRRTDEAKLAGAFGVPTFVVHADGASELYWGQDRIQFVEAHLARAERDDPS